MTNLTAEHLRQVMPNLPADRAEQYLPHLTSACAEFEIDTHPRMSYFLGQLAHESGELRYWKELGGEAYLTSKPYYPYVGYGPIQVTWRENHAKIGARLGLDLINRPDLLMLPEHGFRGAAAFWRGTTNGVDLNYYADQPGTDSFNKIMATVLGTANHGSWQSRADYTNRAWDVLPKDLSLMESDGAPRRPDHVLLASGSQQDAALCHVAVAVLERMELDAEVADEHNIADWFKACQATPIGTYDFFVVGGPARGLLPEWVHEHILPAEVQQKSRQSDYIDCIGADYSNTGVKLQQALRVFYGRDAARQFVRMGGRRITESEWWEKGGIELEIPEVIVPSNTEKALAYAISLLNRRPKIKYWCWDGGSLDRTVGGRPGCLDGPPPRIEQISQFFCADLTNLMLRHLGKPVPKNGVYPGGTRAYKLAYQHAMIKFELHEMRRGDCAFVDYQERGDQFEGHIGVSLGDGPDAPFLQSFARNCQYLEPGLTADWTIRQSHDGGFYTHRIPREAIWG